MACSTSIPPRSSEHGSHLITGLPDAYGRGRIIGDYRRVALYGVDALIAAKKLERASLDLPFSTEDVVRDREENAEQVRALRELLSMAALYGFDISGPAQNAREAVQWLYFAYLGAVKEQNGAAMSFGRNTAFLDIYLQRELVAGTLNEEQAQELIDDLVIKLRIVRFLRTPEYDALFSGDPTWVTESLGGIGDDGRPLVTKTAFRFLQTLYNLGPAPEPNLTVFWSSALPDGFKRFCTRVSIDTSAIQYESDDLIREAWGDDAAIACCVSPMAVGKQMQFFGARVNIAKSLLYSINGGRDELTGEQIAPVTAPLSGDVLDFDTVWSAYQKLLAWLAETYLDALNCIHHMHDKYAYERLEMALHDGAVLRTMACGIAGLSVAADSLSAIKYATVRPVRDASGLVVDYEIEGDYPAYGNDDDRADEIATMIVERLVHAAAARPARLSRRHDHPVGAHDHLQRGLWREDRKHAGWQAGRRTIRTRRQSDERARHARDARLGHERREDPLLRLAGRHLAHHHDRAGGPRADAGGAGDEPGRPAGCVHAGARLSPQRERAQPGDAARRDGASRRLPAADHPGLRLRRQLRAAHPRTAAGRRQPHLPQHRLTMTTIQLDRQPHEQQRHDRLEGTRTGTVASVHSWELVTAVDGPGTWMTLFLTGCPLRCQYCQNPDTWRMRDGAVTGIEEVLDRIRHYRGIFAATGGGVTISGGEPLMQSAFVERVYAECRSLGIHTALDTSGFLGRHASDQLLKNTSLVLLDVKSGSEDLYLRVTGASLQPTIDFGDRLDAAGIPIWVRFVLVPGLTDGEDNVENVARIVARWSTVERVEVLPFHQMGENKWDRLSLPYQLHSTQTPDDELQERVREQFRAHGLTVL